MHWQSCGADVTLSMHVADAAATNAQGTGMAIYESDMRQRMMADAKKAALAHAEAARREKRLAEEEGLAVDQQRRMHAPGLRRPRSWARPRTGSRRCVPGGAGGGACCPSTRGAPPRPG